VSKANYAPDGPRCPEQGLQAAEVLCGRPYLELVTDRRGTCMWKATGPLGSARIKTGYDTAVETTLREAAVMAALPGYTVVSGVSGDVAWLVSPWLEGPSTWEVFQPVRDGAAVRAQALTAAGDLCRTVADLHGRGWVHADLQPDHAVHTAGGVRLLDLSWAWCETFDQSPAFRGGSPHLLAPELAASISLGIQPVKPTAEAEVYALAGLLWRCATGRWPLDYQTADIDPDAHRPAHLRALIANRKIPLDESETSWPALTEVLRPVLLARRAERPTAAELGEQMSAVDLGTVAGAPPTPGPP